ncbi:MAG: PepSY-associated TM helix domain-containing protein [Candidatus Symbiothrix sp.]|jgi:hypothetical protein|nr:PepSY-associated TM helix domain-containing protein [Candidatus Symbiothrix sp.]
MKIRHWLRTIHRDLGFLLVGLSLVYAISGIILNHLPDHDPAYRTEIGTLSFPANLSQQALNEAWQAERQMPAIKKILSIDENHFRLMLNGGVAVYNSTTGTVDYETYRQRFFIYWLNRLHYSKVKAWNPVADFFAASVIFLAISGLFIVKGKRSISGTGKWYLLVGLLIPVIFVIISCLG